VACFLHSVARGGRSVEPLRSTAMHAKDSRLSRTLALVFRPFSKVEPREAALVAVLTLAAFLLLTAYYLLKTVREPLILLQGGAEVKIYARASQALIMAVFVHFYGELAKRVGRLKLLIFVFLFFISNLALFAVLARASVSIGLAFFLWVGVFSYTIVAQFWALAADLFSEEQGKRLFPIIGGGSSIGAVAGAALAKSLVPLGVFALMACGVVILLACAALVSWAGRRSRSEKQGAAAQTRAATESVSDQGAFQLLFHDKYLLSIAGLVIFLNWVNSSGEYLLDRTLLAAAHDAAAHGVSPQQFIGAFKADYYAWYNSIGLVLELFAVSRILRLVGVEKALYFLPCFALGAYGVAVFAPVLAVMRWVKIGENSLQYSLQDTTRHALFLAASRAEKFVGKTAVDTVAVRIGAIMSATLVWVGARGGWSSARFALINVALSCAWLGFVVAIGKQRAARQKSPPVELAAAVSET
jgi:ATP:ADP antiporter, AAA family